MLLVFLASVSLIAAASGQAIWLMITVPTMVSIVAFLRFNWAPAKIFLGDSGSLSLGFLVAYLSLGVALTPTASGGGNWSLWLSLLLVSVWLADTALAVTRRYVSRAPKVKVFLRRSKLTYFVLHQAALKSVMKPDCRHLHHMVLKLGFDPKRTVFIICLSLLGAHSSAIAVWMMLNAGPSSGFVTAGLLPSLLLSGSVLIGFYLFDLLRNHRQLLVSDESADDSTATKVA